MTRFSREDIHDAPPEGVYIHGLFLEGASLDRKSGKLVESKAKILFEQMPVIYMYAINTTAGKDARWVMMMFIFTSIFIFRDFFQIVRVSDLSKARED